MKREFHSRRWGWSLGMLLIGCTMAPPVGGSKASGAGKSEASDLGRGVADLRLVRQVGEETSFCGTALPSESLEREVFDTAAELWDCVGSTEGGRCWQLLAADARASDGPAADWKWGLALGWPAASGDGKRALQDLLTSHRPRHLQDENRLKRALRQYVRVPEPKRVVAGLSAMLHGALLLRKRVHPGWVVVQALLEFLVQEQERSSSAGSASGTRSVPDSTRYARSLAAAGQLLATVQGGDHAFGHQDPRNRVLDSVFPELERDATAPFPAFRLHRDSALGREILQLVGKAAQQLPTDLFAVTLTVVYPRDGAYEVAPHGFSGTSVTTAGGPRVSLPVVQLLVNLTEVDFVSSTPGYTSRTEPWLGEGDTVAPGSPAHACTSARGANETCVGGASARVAWIDPRDSERDAAVRLHPVGHEHREHLQELDVDYGSTEGPDLPASPAEPPLGGPVRELCASPSPPSGSGVGYIDDVREILAETVQNALFAELHRLESMASWRVDCETMVKAALDAIDALAHPSPNQQDLKRMLEHMWSWMQRDAGALPADPPDLALPVQGPFALLPNIPPQDVVAAIGNDLTFALGRYRRDYSNTHGFAPTRQHGNGEFAAATVLVCQDAADDDHPDPNLYFAPDSLTDSRGLPVIVHLWNLGPTQPSVVVHDVPSVGASLPSRYRNLDRGEHIFVLNSRGDSLDEPREIRVEGVPSTAGGLSYHGEVVLSY